MGESDGIALLAGRLPIIISRDPWVMGAGLLVLLIYIAARASAKRAHARDQYRGGLPDMSDGSNAVDDVRQLVGDIRYREAMEVFTQATRRGEREPVDTAVEHLESQGVPPDEARMNLIRIILVLHSMRQDNAS